MHGPYSAKVKTSTGEFTLDETEVEVGDRIADRFYEGAGIRTLVGFTRAATFTVATLLANGEDAEVDIVGRVGTEGSSRPCQVSAFGGDHRFCSYCDGTGRETARDCDARRELVRRDSRGRVLTTLGSRFRERVFNGV